MRLLSKLLIVVFYGFAAQAFAAAKSEGRDALDAFLSNVTAYGAVFEQSVFDETGELIESAKGRLLLHRPGRFRWSYSEPYEQYIIGDGKKVWIYDPDLSQVTVRKLDKTIGQTPAVLLTSRGGVDESFTVRDVDKDDGLAWVGLVPKGADAAFKDVTIAFLKGQLDRMELEDHLGQKTQIRFSSATTSPKWSESDFAFEPPAGVDVMDDTQ